MNNNRIIYRIIAAIIALTLIICAFSSCTGKEEDPEITRGTQEIEGPSETSTLPGEVTTDPAATAENTTKAGLLSDFTLSASVNANTTAPNLTPNQNAGVNDAANSSGISPEKLSGFISAMGFEYDANQGIFYTNLDNWQRSANYVSHYDTFAQFGNMRYRTAKIDFGSFDGLDWRIQIWKGQYGVFGGSEVGVYTKNPIANEMLYNCADNDHLLYMETSLYLNKEDYESSKLYFSRDWQAHWWLTGFKAGVVDPTTLIMKIRIRLKTPEMADMFCNALEVTGFTRTDSAYNGYDTYYRLGRDVYILWDDVGEMNYIQQTPKAKK